MAVERRLIDVGRPYCKLQTICNLTQIQCEVNRDPRYPFDTWCFLNSRNERFFEIDVPRVYDSLEADEYVSSKLLDFMTRYRHYEAHYVTESLLLPSRRTLVTPKIVNVVFNDPATIVIWDDGTKTIVKCGKNESFDKEKGLSMAISKKFLGTNKSHGNYYNIIKEWLDKDSQK